MRRWLILLMLGTPAFSLADEPVAPVDAPTIVAPKECTGTGKRDAPFEFSVATKCILRLADAPADVRWDTEDAPANLEVIDGKLAVFSLAEPGTYQVIAHGTGCYVRCWFAIKSGTDPPKPEESGASLSRRVKAALAGNPGDAVKFAAVCDSLIEALPKINRLGELETKMKAGLDAVGWVAGRYPDLSTIAGELFGKQVTDRALTDSDRAGFSKSLATLSAACKAVVK